MLPEVGGGLRVKQEKTWKPRIGGAGYREQVDHGCALSLSYSERGLLTSYCTSFLNRIEVACSHTQLNKSVKNTKETTGPSLKKQKDGVWRRSSNSTGVRAERRV